MSSDVASTNVAGTQMKHVTTKGSLKQTLNNQSALSNYQTDLSRKSNLNKKSHVTGRPRLIMSRFHHNASDANKYNYYSQAKNSNEEP